MLTQHVLARSNIGLFPNSGRLVKRWGIHYELSKHCAYPDGLRYYRYNGEFITHQRHQKQGDALGDENPFEDAPLYDTTRYELHRILIKRAKELGADVRLSSCQLLLREAFVAAKH